MKRAVCGALACGLFAAASAHAAEVAPSNAPEAIASPKPARSNAPATETDYGRLGSAVGVGGLYSSLMLYITLAWWNDSDNKVPWHTRSEGWFGKRTYAGGADKLGHAWTNYVLVRGMSGILTRGGWNQRGSLMVSTGLSLAFWTVAEVKDGFYGLYGFSYEDMIANSTGALLGVAFELVPELDRRLDFRVEYLPSSGFIRETREKGVLNAPEDYDGQTYLLCYHLASHEFSQENPWLTWTTYVDLTAGFSAVYYHPVPIDPETRREQNLFMGVSLNLQPLLEQTTGTFGRTVHFASEIYQIPFTTLAVGTLDRSTSQPMSLE